MTNDHVNEGEAIPNSGRAGFCQDCGRPLTPETIRTVGSGVFCEPCLERRVAAGPASVPGNSAGYSTTSSGAGWQPTGGEYPPPPPVPPPPGTPIYTGVPTPWLAGLLGFIPGVGAMYNGQFAKGVIHLIVFAVLVSLADNVSGVFGLFVAGWIFFMAFEAYHTARARRDGLPLPDPFGWNNIGERLGFGKNWPGSFTSGVPPTQPGSPSNAAWQQQPPPPAQPGADWVGYVPPSNYATTPDAGVPPTFASRAPLTEVPLNATAVAGGAASGVPYPQAAQQAPYGAPGVPYREVAMDPATTPVIVPARRFPVGAMWLIGLGLLFLLGNIDRSLRLSWRWLTPAILASLAVYLLVTRLRTAAAAEAAGRSIDNKVCLWRAPVMLMTIAVLFALQSARALTFGQTWPVLLVVFGALLLLERTAGRSHPAGPIPVMDSDAAASPSSWNAAKGGQ